MRPAGERTRNHAGDALNWRRRVEPIRIAGLAGAAGLLIASAGCHLDMWEQNKVKAQAPSEFFADGQGARPLLIHTVARAEPYHQLWAANPAISDDNRVDNPAYTGLDGRNLINQIPPDVVRKFPDLKSMLLRGQDRFNIFCTPCHSRLGDGQGMIAQRGFALRRPPASYHTARLMKMPIGHFFDVMTNGYGTMFSYAERVKPVDRWAIASYIRVLQFSQNGALSDVPPEKMSELNSSPVTPPPGETAAQ